MGDIPANPGIPCAALADFQISANTIIKTPD